MSDKKKDSTEELRISFDHSLQLDRQKQEAEKPKRFSPYSSKQRRSLTTTEKKSQPRRRHKSEPVAQQDEPDYTNVKPPVVKKRAKTKQELVEQKPEIIDLSPQTQSCHEDISVNELASYLEYSTLIPRKMSSMAESIYG